VVQKRDFNKEAAVWDEKPLRLKLAADVGLAMRETVELGPGMACLDFGCGTGLVSLQVQPYVGSILAVDSAQAMLDILQAKLDAAGVHNIRPQRIAHDGADMPVGPFDLIFSNMTLHHVPDPASLLAQFVERLAPGGVVCISDLDAEDGSFHDDGAGVFHHGFERERLGELFLEAGLTDLRARDAALVQKPRQGGMRGYPMFLMVGRKA
jgi:2-polyprenyl-3-methyl-5-hydroxy-6-metoxy-1,4-benzoquinol methylase